MHKILVFFTLVIVSAYSQAETTSAEDFCTGKTPDKDADPILYELYKDSSCADVRVAWIAKVKASNAKADKEASEIRKDQSRENLSADVDLAKKISDAVKTTNKDLPTLSAFSSTAKRYLSDIGYKSGIDIGKRIAKETTLERVIVFESSDLAAQWVNQPPTETLIKDLVKIESNSKIITNATCDVVAKPKAEVEQKTGVLPIGATLAAAKAVLDTGVAIAAMFQPQISSAESIDGPPLLKSSIISGIQTGYILEKKAQPVFYSRPPLITQSNKVILQANKSAMALKEATSHVEGMTKKLKPTQQLEPKCSEKVASALSEATKLYALKTTKDLTPSLGSAIDQGARKAALEEANIDSFVIVNIVVAGGAVSGYQRNRFSSIKLIAGSDLALVVQTIPKTNAPEISYYLSVGCGKAIPLGEFTSEYSKSSCLN